MAWSKRAVLPLSNVKSRTTTGSAGTTKPDGGNDVSCQNTNPLISTAPIAAGVVVEYVPLPESVVSCAERCTCKEVPFAARTWVQAPTTISATDRLAEQTFGSVGPQLEGADGAVESWHADVAAKMRSTEVRRESCIESSGLHVIDAQSYRRPILFVVCHATHFTSMAATRKRTSALSLYPVNIITVENPVEYRTGVVTPEAPRRLSPRPPVMAV